MALHIRQAIFARILAMGTFLSYNATVTESMMMNVSIRDDESWFAKQGNQTIDDLPESWSELLSLVSELLRTVDDSLSKSNINFADAFGNACGFISNAHPFLDPDSDVFSYSGGYIGIRGRLSPNILTSGIVAALGRIMTRLREDPYFGNVYHLTMHRIRVLANQRKLQFDEYSITTQLQKVIGI